MTRIDALFDNAVHGLEKHLELTWRRNEAISSNLANAETPQYRAVDLSFSSELSRAFGNDEGKEVSTTNPLHLDLLQNSGAHLISDLTGQTRADGNNVDIDVQMGKLTKNSIDYSAATTFLQKKFATLLLAIRQS